MDVITELRWARAQALRASPQCQTFQVPMHTALYSFGLPRTRFVRKHPLLLGSGARDGC